MRRSPQHNSPRTPHTTIPFGAVLAIVLVIALAGCTGGSGSTFKQRTGTEGLTIEFMKNAPATSVYEDRPFPVRVQVHNKGARDVEYKDMRLTFSYDPLYVGGGKSPYDPREYDFDNAGIQGRSLSYRDGQKTTFIIPSDAAFFAKRILGQRESPDTEIVASVCYAYSTTVSTDVCIDTNLYQENERAQPCKQEDISFSGGQGAPIAVTKIEVRAVPLYNKETKTETVKPEFIISISDVGKGYLIGPDTLPLENACMLKSIPREQLSAVHIDAWLMNTQLVCGNTAATKEAGLVKLYEGKADVSCTVPSDQLSDPLYSATQNFQSVLQLNISYLYKASIKAPISIERTPGTVYEDFPAWMTQKSTGATYVSTVIAAVEREKAAATASATPTIPDSTSQAPALVDPAGTSEPPTLVNADPVPPPATQPPEIRAVGAVETFAGTFEMPHDPLTYDPITLEKLPEKKVFVPGQFDPVPILGTPSYDFQKLPENTILIPASQDPEVMAKVPEELITALKEKGLTIDDIIPPGYTLASPSQDPLPDYVATEDPGYDLGGPEETPVFKPTDNPAVPTITVAPDKRIEDLQIVSKTTGKPLEQCDLYANNPSTAPAGIKDNIRGFSCSCSKTQCDAVKDSKMCFTGLCSGAKYCCAPSATKVPVSTVTSSLIKDPKGDVAKTINNLNKYPGLTTTVEQAAIKRNVDPRLMIALFTQESGGNPLIINSVSGCAGLGQFEYNTAKDAKYSSIFGSGLRGDCQGICGSKSRCDVTGTKCAGDPRFDPFKSAQATPQLFIDKLRTIRKFVDFSDEVRVGLAAYNGGEGVMIAAIRATNLKKPTWDDIAKNLNGDTVLRGGYCKKMDCGSCSSPKVCVPSGGNNYCCSKYWSTASARENKAKEIKQYVERIMTYYAVLNPGEQALAKAETAPEDAHVAKEKEEIADTAVREWEYFNQGTKKECDTAVVERVEDYYKAGRCSSTSSCKATPWSAGFISYVMKESGVNFPYNCAHWNYFTAIRDSPTKYSCTTQRMSAANSLQPGDLVCACREGGCPTTYDMPSGQRNTHCDVVVDVTPTAVTVIGGNVADTVKRRTISKSTLTTNSAYYGIIQCA